MVLDLCHNILCICTKLNLRGGVSCMPAAFLFYFVSQGGIFVYDFLFKCAIEKTLASLCTQLSPRTFVILK